MLGAKLSKRERECALWMARGKTRKQASIIMCLSEQTVRTYLEIARRKYDAPNTTALVAQAIIDGTININEVAYDS